MQQSLKGIFEERDMLSKTRANVLVVEDSLAVAKRLQISLQQAGWGVEIARNGQEAWEMARRRQFDLVITDEQMPIMSGRQLCQHLRADDRYADTPIIFLTAKQFGNEFESDLSISTSFSKPFNPTALVRAVESELSAAGRARRKSNNFAAQPKRPESENTNSADCYRKEVACGPRNESFDLFSTFLIPPPVDATITQPDADS